MTLLQRRLTPCMQVVFVQGLLIAVEGLAVLVSLLLEPSQSGGFLGFSAARWILVLLNLLALVGVFFGLHEVWNNRANGLESWLSEERRLFQLLFITILLFGFSLPACLGTIAPVRDFASFGRVRPFLAWLALASGQAGLALLFILRRPVLRWFRQFFPLKDSTQRTVSLSRSQRGTIAGTALAFLAFQLASFLQVGQARWLPDSIDYIFPAENYMWTEPGLWTHTKPWGAAVLYKLTGSSPVTIGAVQTLLSAFAWLSLAWVFSSALRAGWVRAAAFALVLGFGLAPSVQMWNHIIQSESLSISLLALILAAWISLLRSWRWEKLFALVLLFAWWMGTRETNVYLSLLAAAALFVVGLISKRQRFYWALVVLLVLSGYINLQISERPTIPRWLYPLTNTVLNRILPDPEFLRYFEDRGFPTSPQLLSLSGGFADSGDFAVFNHPELNEAEAWLYRRGKEVYIRFLLDHPVYTLASPWQNARELLAPQDLMRYAPERYRPALGWLWEGVFYPASLGLVLPLAAVVLVFTLATSPWREQPVFWLVLGFGALFFPNFYLAWHGDAFEVGRHAIQASIQLRLAVWMSLMLVLDKIVRNGYRIRTRHRP